MRKLLIVILFTGSLLFQSACGKTSNFPSTGNKTQPPVTLPASITPVATIEPAGTPVPTIDENLMVRLTNSCFLLDGHDLASLFTRAEVVQNPAKSGPVSHPVFSDHNAAGKETTCLYYDFSNPDFKGDTLQVTYWADIPDPSHTDAWAQAWSQAQKQPGALEITAIGDQAFFQDGHLSFKKGTLFFTLEVIGTNIDPKTSAGADQQLEIEKRLALDMLGRLD